MERLPVNRSPAVLPEICGELVLSIARFYDVVSPEMEISPASISPVVSLIEYFLRITIQEARKLSRTSIASMIDGLYPLTFVDVLAALDVLKAQPFREDWHTMNSTCGGPSLSNANFYQLRLNAVETHKIFLGDLFLPAKLSTQVDQRNGDQLVNTREYAAKQVLENLSMPRPRKLTIHWVAVDGQLVSTRANNFVFKTQLDHTELPKLIINLRIPDPVLQDEQVLNALQREKNLFLDQIGIVSQISKVNHAISREHLILLNRIRQILRKTFLDPAEEYQELTMKTLKIILTSPGIRQLTHYLIHFATSQIYAALSLSFVYSKPAAGIRVMIRTLLAIVENKSYKSEVNKICNRAIFNSPQMHQITQAIQLVVLHPLLGYSSMTLPESISLRYVAGKALQRIVQQYAVWEGGYLARTVAQMYLDSIKDEQLPITTIMGAVIGLKCLGQMAVRTLLLPTIPYLAGLISLCSAPPSPTAGPSKASPIDSDVVEDIKKSLVIELLSCISMALQDVSESSWSCESPLPFSFPKMLSLAEQLWEALGDSLVPLVSDITNEDNRCVDFLRNVL